MEEENKYHISAITHVFNRIKISIYNYDTDESYNLDLTKSDFQALLSTLIHYEKNGDFEDIDYQLPILSKKWLEAK